LSGDLAADRVLRVSDIGDVSCIRSAISIVAEYRTRGPLNYA